MEKIFYPESIVIVGLSSKAGNTPKLILENLIRWGYTGRIFGVNPSHNDLQVNGIRMYKTISELPIVPDLAVTLIPAKFVPQMIEDCGKFGIKRMAVPSGGFNESGAEGKALAEQVRLKALEYGIRFVGPNGVTVANTANGLCLPFVPSYMPARGGVSIITQSGGIGLLLWNLMTDENVGMAKFASIGNKLDLDEVDFLEYLGRDPDTKMIWMYLESIPRGEAFLEAAEKIDKPIIVLKASKTGAGNLAAMSHTAALANNDAIVDAAFKRVGIIRVDAFLDFVSVAKAFKLPPMRGDKMMFMSPMGGVAVLMADLCEKAGFRFADPGRDFYQGLEKFSNAGIIQLTNPLDMGDIYDPEMYAQVFYQIMHNEHVDGAVYVSQWPEMPRGDSVFNKMFHTDYSKETIGAVLSSGKPLGVCLLGPANTTLKIKKNLSIPIFNSPDEAVLSLKRQQEYYTHTAAPPQMLSLPEGIDWNGIEAWLAGAGDVAGEESLELLQLAGIPVATSIVTTAAEEAVAAARDLNFPVVLKVVSPEVLHKSDAGGVIVGVRSEEEVERGFEAIRSNLQTYSPEARFEGVRVMEMAPAGYDMFIGGQFDQSFGPVAFFGYGGIYIEVFKDVQAILCPASGDEITGKIQQLKSSRVLQGARGATPADVAGYVDVIERISHVLARFRNIKELDINPLRLLADGSGVIALDARIRIEPPAR